MLRDDIFSGTQHGSGTPGTTPTARTMLWMDAWLEGFKACGAETEQMTANVTTSHAQKVSRRQTFLVTYFRKLGIL